MPVGIGVIGCGMMGEVFARVVAESRDARLAGVCDVDRERADRLAAAWGVPSHARAEELVESAELDAVIVATSDQHHLEPCILALTGGKHVLVEKPLATSLDEARRIAECARNSGRVLMVGHTLRFDPRYVRARDSLVAGDVGDIVYMYSRRNGACAQSGLRLAGRTSVAYYLGIHDIDFMRWCTRCPVTAVFAVGRKKLLEQLGIHVHDVVLALLEFADGVVASVETCWVMPDGSPRPSPIFELVGTKGAIHVHAYELGLSIQVGNQLSRPNVLYENVMHGRQYGVYAEEVRHFLDCVLRGESPVVSPDEAVEAVAAVGAIEQSLQTGRRVVLAG